jgi:hypothetical protein
VDRSTDPVSTRVLLWGVVAPLLVGSFVPALSAAALVWLLVGLATLMVQAVASAVRRVDPGEDGAAWDVDDVDDLAAFDDVEVREPAVPGRWWSRPVEDPNTAAARAGSWG